VPVESLALPPRRGERFRSTTQQTTSVIDALMASSDHLPVVADYQLPARLAVAAPAIPATVLRGATVAGNLAVSNSAPVAGGGSYEGLGLASGLARGSAAAPDVGDFFSDVLTLQGTAGDAIVLSLTYDAGALGDLLPGDLFLAWLDTRAESDTAGEWVKSVAGNSVDLVTRETAYLGSWEAYLVEFAPASPAAALGAWGVDAASTSVWAVVDHNSQFAVVAVPEPATWLLLAAAAGAAWWRRRVPRAAA